MFSSLGFPLDFGAGDRSRLNYTGVPFVVKEDSPCRVPKRVATRALPGPFKQAPERPGASREASPFRPAPVRFRQVWLVVEHLMTVIHKIYEVGTENVLRCSQRACYNPSRKTQVRDLGLLYVRGFFHKCGKGG